MLEYYALLALKISRAIVNHRDVSVQIVSRRMDRSSSVVSQMLLNAYVMELLSESRRRTIEDVEWRLKETIG